MRISGKTEIIYEPRVFMIEELSKISTVQRTAFRRWHWPASFIMELSGQFRL